MDGWQSDDVNFYAYININDRVCNTEHKVVGTFPF